MKPAIQINDTGLIAILKLWKDTIAWLFFLETHTLLFFHLSCILWCQQPNTTMVQNLWSMNALEFAYWVWLYWVCLVFKHHKSQLRIRNLSWARSSLHLNILISFQKKEEEQKQRLLAEKASKEIEMVFLFRIYSAIFV